MNFQCMRESLVEKPCFSGVCFVDGLAAKKLPGIVLAARLAS